MQKTRLCAAVIVLLVLGGCSSNSDTPDRAATVDATTTTGPPDSTTTTNPSVDIDQAQLESVLLTIEDVPTGYAVYTDPTPDDNGSSLCDGYDPASEHPELAKANADFSQGGETGPFIYNSVAVFSPGEAEAFMESMSDAFNACQTFTETNADGTTYTFTLSPLSFPSFGDETLATRATFDAGIVSGVADLVYVRNGNSIFQVSTLGMGSTDTTVTEAMTRAAQAKVEAAT